MPRSGKAAKLGSLRPSVAGEPLSGYGWSATPAALNSPGFWARKRREPAALVGQPRALA